MSVRFGEVWELGKHRIMCGDAGNPAHVRELFGRRKPDLVFTSPPYDKQRDYTQKIDCWQTLMQRVFAAMPHHERTQVLVNLGLVHRKGEWVPYWEPWIEWMRTSGWQRCGWYVWDKGHCIAQRCRGRLMPHHEFIFHLRRGERAVNKTLPCKTAGTVRPCVTRRACGVVRDTSRFYVTASLKVSGSVLQIPAKMERHGHPAVFPVALPAAIHAAYSDPGELVYDPFAGSGTSILAAEQQGRVCYAMEIAPEYCDIVLARWNKQRGAT